MCSCVLCSYVLCVQSLISRAFDNVSGEKILCKKALDKTLAGIVFSIAACGQFHENTTITDRRGIAITVQRDCLLKHNMIWQLT